MGYLNQPAQMRITKQARKHGKAPNMEDAKVLEMCCSFFCQIFDPNMTIPEISRTEGHSCWFRPRKFGRCSTVSLAELEVSILLAVLSTLCAARLRILGNSHNTEPFLNPYSLDCLSPIQIIGFNVQTGLFW